jgi:Gluconate 2-dehydrogenase subunit 3
MKRRTAIKIVALSAVSSNLDTLTYGLCHSDAGTAWSAANYHLRFFTPEENQLLDQLMEMVIPADGHSPGAHAAQVSLFADLMVSTSSAAVQKQWREGLKLIQEESTKSSLAEALAKSAANEGHPTTDLERFFRALKHMTVNGYYTSAIGIHQDLQYQGNAYLTAFPGCAQFPARPEPGKKTGDQPQARSSHHFCNQ